MLHDVIKYYVIRNAKNFARFQSLLSFIYGSTVGVYISAACLIILTLYGNVL